MAVVPMVYTHCIQVTILSSQVQRSLSLTVVEDGVCVTLGERERDIIS